MENEDIDVGFLCGISRIILILALRILLRLKPHFEIKLLLISQISMIKDFLGIVAWSFFKKH